MNHWAKSADAGFGRRQETITMFELTIATAFVVFVVSPCISVLRPGAHRTEDQTYVL